MKVRGNPTAKLALRLILAAVFTLLWSHASPAQLDKFAIDTIYYTGGRYQNSPISYRIFVPEMPIAGPSWPLFVWLHGKGEIGNDNRHQLAWLYEIMGLDRDEAFPAFLVALQCPQDNSSWYRDSENVVGGGADGEGPTHGDEMITVLRAIIDKTICEHPIDRDRIYLVGLCKGGDACWELALRYPDLFAAMSTLADRGRFDERSRRILNLPIWSFHSAGDDPEELRHSIRGLQELGGNCHLTEIPSKYHDCWNSAFFEYDLRQWLLAQRRGENNAPPPGTMTWRSRWKVLRRDYLCMDFLLGSLFVPLVAIVSVMACRGELQRRRRSNSSSNTMSEAI